MSGLKELHLDFHGGGAPTGIEKKILEAIVAAKVKTASGKPKDSKVGESE